MRNIVLRLLILPFIVTVASCQSFRAGGTPTASLNFVVSEEVNPNHVSRPSPVVAKVYELASPSGFQGQEFFALYDAPVSTLRTDLLGIEELVLEPGQQIEINMELHPATKALGVLLAFRDIENALWRAVVEVDPTKNESHYVYVESLAVYIRESGTSSR